MASFEDAGELELKNIEFPVKAFHVLDNKGTPRFNQDSETIETVVKEAEPGSVAVMFFKNLSNDEEQEYFCEGFSEDLLSMLSRYNKLVVISSHASFAYKEKSKSFKEIGKELGVRYVIHGSVRKLGPRMRIKDARQTFLGIWIRNLLEGKTIQVFGDGKQRRDYNYIEDVLDALLITATKEEAVGKVYNLGAPNPLSLEDTAKIMCLEIEGSDYQMIAFPEDRKVIDVGDFICDYSAFCNQFGWEPKVNFEEGIQRSINYFKKEIKHYI